MRLGLLVHGHRQDALGYAARAAKFLMNHGAAVEAEAAAAQRLDGVETLSGQKLDALICLGGDGTILRGAQLALKWHAPLLGVNLGNAAFLAETEVEELEEAMQALLEGRYAIEDKPLLAVTTRGERYLALNDVVITRGGYSRLISVTALVDGDAAGRYVADGVIVATPTGSTGYSLSAGGPVVSPQVDCMVITPICAHSLQHRPTVVHGSAVLRLLLGADTEQSAMLEVDGQTRAELRAGDMAEIRRAPETLQLIRFHQGHFFQLLRDKLIEWSR